MTQKIPQLPWTDEQWDRVQQVITEEARKARVAANFLPIVGPLPPGSDYVSDDILDYENERFPPPALRMRVADTTTRRLCTLEVRVSLRGPQVADPELSSALQMFRRAANTLARLEDAIIFMGRTGNRPNAGTANLAPIWTVGPDAGADIGLSEAAIVGAVPVTTTATLVTAVSDAIGEIEAAGHAGPFACVLDQGLFNLAQTSDRDSLVPPHDRILALLGGGPLLRSSALEARPAQLGGVVMALGGAPVDLVVARDITLSFLQLTLEPRFVFRVHEKLVLRIKQEGAIVGLLT